MLGAATQPAGGPGSGWVRTMARTKRPHSIGPTPGASHADPGAAPAPQPQSQTQAGKAARRRADAARLRQRSRRKREIRDGDFLGLKYFPAISRLLKQLHDCGTERDKAGNRILHYDQYCSLILLFYFNPIIRTLRGIQQASRLATIQKKLGCAPSSLGSLSEAARVFDSALLRQMIPQLAGKVMPSVRGKEASALRDLIAVDGSLLPALPKMAWALWRDQGHRAAKMHVHFDVFQGVPENVTVTHGSGSEREQLPRTLQAHRLYVIDRGYEDYQLFQDIVDAGSSFIARVQEDVAYQVLEQRPLTPDAQAAGVTSDVVLKRLGTAHHKNVVKQPVRIVHVQTDKRDAHGQPQVLVLLTNRLDLSAELVALGYKHRWAVELFFRWFKCILGCRHLLAENQNGVEIQVYLGIIASLLISLWTGKKPTRRTLEMILFYVSGWATWEELQAHIAGLKNHD
jgi:hypothetical protein